MRTFCEIKQMKLKIWKDVELEVAVVIESSEQEEENAESGKIYCYKLDIINNKLCNKA